MPLQYLHTSAKRGLEPGKSGFCCVARDPELPIDLARELERLSCYEHIAGTSNPVILRHLQISIRSGSYHILSRLRDAGSDYSKRNNYIAHHLAFTQDEALSLPDPATILLFWKGWKDAWLEPPRVLGERDRFEIRDLNTSSDSILHEFGSLVVENEAVSHAFLIAEGQEYDLALHYRNELLKIPVSKRWDVPFTNFILVSDRPTLFRWIANWKGRSLPFDLVATPAPAKATEPTIPSKAIEAPIARKSTASARFARNAPTVEIPEELSRKSRRRPKRKWTRNRFSNTLNLGLGALGLICLCVVSYILYNYKNPSVAHPIDAPNPLAPVSTKPATRPTDDARTQWNRLVQLKQLIGESDRALLLASELAEQGDPIPLQIVEVLSKASELENNRPTQAGTVAIQPDLVRKKDSHWELESTLANALAGRGFALLPRPLFEQLSKLRSQTIATERVYDHLLHNRFMPEDADIDLKSLRRIAKDELAWDQLESIGPAEDYLALWLTLSSDNRVEGLNGIENAFGADQFAGFFAVDEEGLLLSPHKTDITAHLVELYEQFLFPRFSSFGNAPEFREALKGARREFDSSIDAAKAIYAVLISAQPQTERLGDRLEKIREQWRKTFIRDDLMEETMINFNVERLASIKSELAQLQGQFDRQTLIDLKVLQSTLHTIDEAEKSLAFINSKTPWALLVQGSN